MEDSRPPLDFDISPEPQPLSRDFTGWIALVIMFTMLISLALYGTLGTGDESLVDPSLDAKLRSVIAVESFQKTKAPDAYEEEIAQTAGERKTNPMAALYYAAMRFESRAEVKPEDVAILRSAKQPGAVTAYQVYTEPNLTKKRAKELSEKLPEDGFVFRVVAAHAGQRAGVPNARAELASSKVSILGALLIMSILVVGTALLVWYGYQRASDALRPVGHPARAITTAQADRYALRAAQLLFAYIGVQFLAAFLPLPSVGKTIVAFGTLIFLSLFLPRTEIRGVRISLAQLGFKNREVGKDVLWGIGTSLAAYPIIFIVGLVSRSLFAGFPAPPHPLSQELQSNDSIGTIMLALFLASVAAPIFEEILFRGHLLPALARVRGSWVYSVVVSSLLFAAIHPTGIPSYLPLATVGAMACLVTIQRGSVLPAVVMHATHNFITLLIVLTIA